MSSNRPDVDEDLPDAPQPAPRASIPDSFPAEDVAAHAALMPLLETASGDRWTMADHAAKQLEAGWHLPHTIDVIKRNASDAGTEGLRAAAAEVLAILTSVPAPVEPAPEPTPEALAHGTLTRLRATAAGDRWYALNFAIEQIEGGATVRETIARISETTTAIERAHVESPLKGTLTAPWHEVANLLLSLLPAEPASERPTPDALPPASESPATALARIDDLRTQMEAEFAKAETALRLTADVSQMQHNHTRKTTAAIVAGLPNPPSRDFIEELCRRLQSRGEESDAITLLAWFSRYQTHREQLGREYEAPVPGWNSGLLSEWAEATRVREEERRREKAAGDRGRGGL